VTSPEGYRPTAQERREVILGDRLIIYGSALAAQEVVCETAGSCEIMWYYLTDKEGIAIVDVWVPEQSAGPGYCHVEGRAVVLASRAARRAGLRIVSSGHHHGAFGSFTSSTDVRNLHELAREAVGFSGNLAEVFPGDVQEPSPGPGAVRFGFAETREAVSLQAASPQQPGDAPLRGSGLSCKLERSRRVGAVTFATSNSRREHMFPTLAYAYCPACGELAPPQLKKPEAVTLQIIGPVTIDHARREELRREVRGKLRRYAPLPVVRGGYPSPETPALTTANRTSTTAWGQGTASAEPAPAASYAIIQHGKRVATVPPDVMTRLIRNTELGDWVV
jgi:hypothetical protein